MNERLNNVNCINKVSCPTEPTLSHSVKTQEKSSWKMKLLWHSKERVADYHPDFLNIQNTLSNNTNQNKTKEPTKPTKQQQPPPSPPKRNKSDRHKLKSKNNISCKMRLNNHSIGETLTINLEQYTIFCASISNKKVLKQLQYLLTYIYTEDKTRKQFTFIFQNL